MAIPKKYFHDRIVLLLLSAGAFLTVVGSVFILLRIDSSRTNGYIVGYRQLGTFGFYEKGNVTTVAIQFIGFMVLVLVFHTLLSMRVYHMRRHASLTVLGLGVFLLLMSVVVSNALLV